MAVESKAQALDLVASMFVRAERRMAASKAARGIDAPEAQPQDINEQQDWEAA